MIKTANPEHDAERHYDDSLLKKLPSCADCGEVIQDEYCFIDDDGVYCSTCFLQKYRFDTEKFLEGGY